MENLINKIKSINLYSFNLRYEILKSLKVYYDLSIRCICKKNKKFDTNDKIENQSFFYSLNMNNFQISNSILDLIKDEYESGIEKNINDYSHNLLMKYFKKYFMEYYQVCPDYSNYFIIFIFEIFNSWFDLDDKTKKVILIELESTYLHIVKLLQEFMCLKCENIPLQKNEIILNWVSHKLRLNDDALFSLRNFLNNNQKLIENFGSFQEDNINFLYVKDAYDIRNIFQCTEFLVFKVKLDKFPYDKQNFSEDDENLQNFCISDMKDTLKLKCIFYDESEFSNDQSDSSLSFYNIDFNSSTAILQLVKMIQDFIFKLRQEEIKIIFIIDDEASGLSKYKNIFIENRIKIYKISRDYINDLKSFTEKNSGISVNLFSYKICLDKEVVSNYEIQVFELNNFEGNSELYFGIRSRENNFKLCTFIINGSHLLQCKFYKKILLKLLKLYKLTHLDNFKFIKISEIIICFEKVVNELHEKGFYCLTIFLKKLIFRLGLRLNIFKNENNWIECFEGVEKM